MYDDEIRAVIQEQGWETFYPDDFKEAFVAAHPDLWGGWVVERGLTGNGNAHQYLTQVLVAMTRRMRGFRLQKTGEQRAPKPPDWGYPVIYEYRVIDE